MLGSTKCFRCLNEKKGCRFTMEESGESEVAEAESQGKKSLITSLKKALLSPIWLLRKHKETDLLPEAIKEKEASSLSSIQVHCRSPFPNLESVSMPPPSITRWSQSSSFLAHLPTDDYAVCHLQCALCELQVNLVHLCRELQEDISWLQEWFMLKEALYLEKITLLKRLMGYGNVDTWAPCALVVRPHLDSSDRNCWCQIGLCQVWLLVIW